jgi:hypothetical protein
MTFKQKIDIQSMSAEMLSDEIMSHQRNKTYSSGRIKNNGEIVLFGITEDLDEEGKPYDRIIIFHEEEIGVLYEEYSDPNKTIKGIKLPNIRKIDNGN